MRAIATLAVAATTFFDAPAAAQALKPPTASSNAMSACTLLTTADYQKATGQKTIYSEPELTRLGDDDSACQFDRVQLVVFWGEHPRAGPSQQRHQAMLKSYKQDQQPREAVAGIGDRAYFMFPKARGEHDRVGMLATQVGPHTLALTLDIATGRTGEAVKAELLALARMIVAKVR